MIKAVFFDYGGVLGAQAISSSYGELIRRGKKIQPYRFKELLIDERILTKPAGTLEALLKSEFKDVDTNINELIDIFRNLPRYDDIWQIARELKNNGIIVGIISDQFAESTKVIREQNHLEDVFEPKLTFFSPETGLSKRTRAIFLKAREAAECNGGEVIFIDDDIKNLDVAAEAGYIGILHIIARLTKEQLANYRLLKNA